MRCLNVATNLLQWCTKGQDGLNHGGGGLVGKYFMVTQILKEFFKKRAKLAPWMEETIWNLFAQIGSHVILWIPSMANVFPLLNGNNHGGYGVVHKVWIERFDYIPNTIELVGKTPKMNDKWNVCKQCLVEALAYSCEHLGGIKFLLIHIKTMEAYTLWRNEGTHNWKMLDYNTKYSPIMDNWT